MAIINLVDMVFEIPHNLTTIEKQLNYINSLTDIGSGGMLGIILLILIGGILFLMMKSFGSDRAIAVTSLSCGIIGIFLRIMNWVNDYVLTICIIFIILGIYLLKRSSSLYES